MAYSAWFQCVRGCQGRWSLYEVIYRCPTCGGLLEVEHDVAALQSRSPAAWMQLLNTRTATSHWPYGSGVWGMREWVMPTLADENVVSMYEGNSNLFWADRLGKQIGVPDLWVKLCGNSHTGSFKDLGMTVLCQRGQADDGGGHSPVQAPWPAPARATPPPRWRPTAGYAGIPTIVFLPSRQGFSAQLIQPIANGALVLALDTDFDGCMSIVKESHRRTTASIWPTR
jgi:threonine synthase